LNSHSTCQFTYNPCLSLYYKPYKCPVGKRKDPPKVSSQEAIKLRKKKKEELSDPPYVPPEEVCNTRSKEISNHSGKKSLEELGKEDGVVGAVDDAEQGHSEVVSHLLTSSMLYQFICCMNSFIV
jgi:hypothetical protein